MDETNLQHGEPVPPGGNGAIPAPALTAPIETEADGEGAPEIPDATAHGMEIATPLPLALLQKLEQTLTVGFAEVRQDFRDKLAYDRFKEDQITRLHEELQAYKNDLIGRLARPLLQGLIRLHDDLGKTTASLLQQPVEELTPERFFRHLADFQDDIELLLGQHGVEPFEECSEVFDPRRQTAARTIPSSDSAQAGTIAQRLRPGFTQGDSLLQKERVAVYAISNGMNDKAQGDQS